MQQKAEGTWEEDDEELDAFVEEYDLFNDNLTVTEGSDNTEDGYKSEDIMDDELSVLAEADMVC